MTHQEVLARLEYATRVADLDAAVALANQWLAEHPEDEEVRRAIDRALEAMDARHGR